MRHHAPFSHTTARIPKPVPSCSNYSVHFSLRRPVGIMFRWSHHTQDPSIKCAASAQAPALVVTLRMPQGISDTKDVRPNALANDLLIFSLYIAEVPNQWALGPEGKQSIPAKPWASAVVVGVARPEPGSQTCK